MLPVAPPPSGPARPIQAAAASTGPLTSGARPGAQPSTRPPASAIPPVATSRPAPSATTVLPRRTSTGADAPAVSQTRAPTHMVKPSAGLNCREAIQNYIDAVLNSVAGMKALLMDDDVKTCVSMVYTQSQILEKSTFLTAALIPTTKDKLDKKLEREKMPHLKGVIICRPTKPNIEAIRQELANPMYGEYHLFFSNTLPQEGLRELAEADRSTVVKQVQEVYLDYLAVNSDLFELGLEVGGQVAARAQLTLQGALKLSRPRARWSREEEDMLFRRAVKGVLAVLLSLRQRPTVRFQAQSELAQHFARALKQEMDQERGMFEFGSAAPPSNSSGETLLLVLDRRDDPVTPLLSQWTYQSMVHQLIGIKHNLVSLENVDDDLKRVVLSQSPSDEFFCQNMFLNYGQLSENTKRMLDTYRTKYDDSRSLKTVEDMQAFVESFPEFKKLANNASKHVAIVGELARLIEHFHLLDISVLEQDLASATVDHLGHLDRVKQKVLDPECENEYKLRLVLLYALKYESHGGNRIGELKQLLKSQDTIHAQVALVDAILAFGGAARRAGDVFGMGGADFLSKTVSMGMRGLRTSVTESENVYTQHKPLLFRTLEDARLGKLSESKYPSTAGPSPVPGGLQTIPAAREVICFILGGATFEEAALVASLNHQHAGFKVLLGGTNVQNAKSFLHELSMLGMGV